MRETCLKVLSKTEIMKFINKNTYKTNYAGTQCFIVLISVLLFSCQSSLNEIDGEWIGESTFISINLKENTIEIKNDLKPKENFKEKIVFFEENVEGKWKIKLTDNKEITLKTFNEDTLFIYDENGYSRLKKQTK
mgnify:CR=1 FL=1